MVISVRLFRLLLCPSTQLVKPPSDSGVQQRTATLLMAAGTACLSVLQVTAVQARLR
jgi:hypothetical protein